MLKKQPYKPVELYYIGARGVSYNSVVKNINYLNVIRQIGSKDVQRIMEAGVRDTVAEVKVLKDIINA